MPSGTVTTRWKVTEDDGLARILRKGEAITGPLYAHPVLSVPGTLTMERD